VANWKKTSVIPRVDQAKLAAQVASLVNKHNNLQYRLTTNRVLNGPVAYLVELDGDIVMGCVGLKKLRRKGWYEICHLCVDPAYRGKRLARVLVEAAYSKIPTGKAWCTIVEHNIPSIRTFLNCGFEMLQKYRNNARGYWVVVMTRERESGKSSVLNSFATSNVQ
jgi:RimJ/RimL family protein N-acetyltransferase